MTQEKLELLQGTLDMLILKALEAGSVHGFGISGKIRQMSRDLLNVEQGSLYPALYRLEAQGLIRAEWGLSENNRKARYYSLTKAGIRELEAETGNWQKLSVAINYVLQGS